MASSRKKKSKEKQNQNLQNSSNADSDIKRQDKRKRKRGCYGKKHKRKGTENSADKSFANHVDQNDNNRNQMSGSNMAGRGNVANHGNPSEDIGYKTSGSQMITGNDPLRNYSYDVTDNFERNMGAVEPMRDYNANISPRTRFDHHVSRYSQEHHVTATDQNDDEQSHQAVMKRPELVNEEMREKRLMKHGQNDSNNPKKSHIIESSFHESSSDRFQRQKRASVVSKVSSSFSSGSSFRRKRNETIQNHSKRLKTEHVSVARVEMKKPTKTEAVVTVQRTVGPSNQRKETHDDDKKVPVLRTNKSYNIKFAMTEKDLLQHGLSTVHSEVRAVESYDLKPKKEIKRKKSSKRIQTDDAYKTSIRQSNINEFSDLMKDFDEVDSRPIRTNEKKRSSIEYERRAAHSTDHNKKSSEMASEWNVVGLSGHEKRNQEIGYEWQASAGDVYGNKGATREWGEASSYRQGNKNNGMGYEWQSSQNVANRSNAVSESWRSNGNNDVGDAVYTAENVVYKEWMIVEHPDGKQEKREYRREITPDGDTNFIDILSGNVLKTEKADWKSGEELIKTKKGTQKIRYEWRKDFGTNEWVKYNADTNEVLKRGDWKTGAEWYRNDKGKLVCRAYTYAQNSDGRWVKRDPRSGLVIDYSNCSALKGYTWVPIKKGGKTKNRKWKKQDYEYIQNNKGKWLKQDPVTKKKLSKPSTSGWKEGVDYHMDKSGKIKKVKYIWQTDSTGLMTKVTKRTKEAVNTTWMRGREIIMKDNNVITNNYCWVKNGRNKWVKVDEDTGKPLTNSIKSNKIASYNQSETPNKTYVSKTLKRTDNNKIIEENTKIEQNGGGVVKNTTTTIKY